jgi:hypothetical protein
MSRDEATFLLSEGSTGLRVVRLGEDLPSDLKQSILGAASFSYYASRVVFCEGEAQSLDAALLNGWFDGRDTVVSPVGSCESVRACTEAFASSSLVDNLVALGVIDRDYRPDSFFEDLSGLLVALPVHEIEGVVCIPGVADALANHLGRPTIAVLDSARRLISEDMILRVALARWRVALLARLENRVTSRPTLGMNEQALHKHCAAALTDGDLGVESTLLFRDELLRVRADAASADIMRLLKVFPSKQLAAAVAGPLGLPVKRLFELMNQALLARQDQPLFALGTQLEVALGVLGLPPRRVASRLAPQVAI